MQLTLPEIKSLGTNLVAVSPQVPEKTMATADDNCLSFPVLSDRDNRLANDFGLVFTMPEKYREMGKKFGLDLAAVNGDDSGELPLTATYIINTDGIIEHAFIDCDYTLRMEPSSIIQMLKSMKS